MYKIDLIIIVIYSIVFAGVTYAFMKHDNALAIALALIL